MSQPHRNQFVVRQRIAFKSERPRISKPRCDSQVDVHNDLSKPVTTHYLPKEREAASAKPHHMIASSNSRISSKNIPRWKPTGKIFKTVGLIWVPIGKIFASSTTKVDNEPLNGSNAYITNQYECEQTLDFSAGLVPQRQKALDYDNSDLVPQRQEVSSLANANVPSQQELDLLFDADHTGCIDSRKSTSRGIQFLGDKLVNWMSKKQNCTAMSSAEAEYVALSASYAQVIWMRTQLQDYGFNYNNIPLYSELEVLAKESA
nr:uncharacterized mitochondrial protein AtMg00810-like [Tanacetum cinerariifolium]